MNHKPTLKHRDTKSKVSNLTSNPTQTWDTESLSKTKQSILHTLVLFHLLITSSNQSSSSMLTHRICASAIGQTATTLLSQDATIAGAAGGVVAGASAWTTSRTWSGLVRIRTTLLQSARIVKIPSGKMYGHARASLYACLSHSSSSLWSTIWWLQ